MALELTAEPTKGQRTSDNKQSTSQNPVVVLHGAVVHASPSSHTPFPHSVRDIAGKNQQHGGRTNSKGSLNDADQGRAFNATH
jgi:hypothetical protein